MFQTKQYPSCLSKLRNLFWGTFILPLCHVFHSMNPIQGGYENRKYSDIIFQQSILFLSLSCFLSSVCFRSVFYVLSCFLFYVPNCLCLFFVYLYYYSFIYIMGPRTYEPVHQGSSRSSKPPSLLYYYNDFYIIFAE